MSAKRNAGPLRRIILVAEHASARLGGEAILPFHYFRLLLARGLDVHLVVHERSRAELEEAFPDARERIHFVPDRAIQKLLYRVGSGLPRRVDEVSLGLLSQLVTQSQQRRLVRKLVVAGAVVHQPISVAPRYPSLLFGLGAPVIVGPLNGGMEYPPAFRTRESLWRRAVVGWGRAASDAVHLLLPGKRRAQVVLVANRRTRGALPAGVSGRVIELAENGVDLEQWRPGGRPASAKHFLFAGRLMDWKALDIVLEAMVHVPSARLEVAGDGPMLETWRSLAASLGVSPRVNFLGWRTQAECADALGDSLALVLPSLYECGGAVVLEAMALGRPVIATAWGGPADYLDASCGILVEPSSREAMVRGFAQAMQHLLDDPCQARTLGEAGCRKVREQFSWAGKIDRMLDIYGNALCAETAEVEATSGVATVS